MTQQWTFRVQITRPDGPPQVVQLRPGANSIGRLAGNDLVLDHETVSRQHARLDCTPTACQLTDLDSTNGTFLGGVRLTPHLPVAVSPGTLFKVGCFALTLEQIPFPEPERELPKPAAQVRAAGAGAEPAKPRRTPPQPPGPPTPPPDLPPRDHEPIPPGLSLESQRLIHYLPGIYHTSFMSRLLAIFESISMPIEWTVDNFDLYLDPRTAPAGFLPWLASWFGLLFDESWTEAQRRTLLSEAYAIYGRRGTRWALSRVLEIYTGVKPEIVDNAKGQAPYTFEVVVPLAEAKVDRARIRALINAHKPAHTSYTLKFK